MFDFLVVGAGFAGAVVAERMARRFNKKVLLIDRRSHVGGNAYDCPDEAGVLIHRYGPHIFHTNSAEVFDYLSQFTLWRPYEHRVLASVDNMLVPIPINLDTVNRLYGMNLTSDQLEQYFASVAEPKEVIRSSEDVVVSRVGRDLYTKLFQGYTRKQWGLDPSQLDSSVIARIPVRTNHDDRYFTDTYQAMPLHGYARMFENMLDDSNVTVWTGVDYRDVLRSVKSRELVYTGAIDEFFDYCYGKLPYRSLRFEHEHVNRDIFQPAAVVNYPNEHAYTRVTEFKYLTGQAHRGTSIVYEYPQAEGDPYYPVPRKENQELYLRYQALAATCPKTHFVGRLATYKYYNMDQVVAQALTLCARITGEARSEVSGAAQSAAAHFISLPGVAPAAS
jgi:UDP-galactopyranose mutase